MRIRPPRWLWPILILLIGFALRVHLLGAKNVWWDEAYSAWLGRKAIGEILRTTAFDVHPPLYYLLLGGWMRLAGDSEFSIRFVGLAAGLLTIAVTYVLGTRIGGRAWGLIGAGLLAISRFHVWWSQETRMYIVAVLWITLALYIVARQSKRTMHRAPTNKWRGWMLFALIVTAALYTLYLGALVMIAAGIGVLILWAVRRFTWRDAALFAAANLVALILYLPWVIYALPRIRSGAVAAPFTPLDVVNLYTLLLGTGISTDIGQYTPIAAAYAIMLIASAGALIAKRRWEAIAILLPGLLLPPLIIYQFTWLNWRFYSPAPEARYFLLFSGVIMLIPAAGIAMIGRWRRWAGAALALVLIGLSAWALPPYYADRHLQDVWKSAVGIIDAYGQPGDVVLMVSADRYPEFLYEYERFREEETLFVVGVPGGIPMLTADTVDEQMKRAIGHAKRVWLVEIESAIQDPEGLARAWMDDQSQAVMTTEYAIGNRLTLFDASGEEPELVHQGDGVPHADIAVHELWPGDTLHVGVFADAGAHTIEIEHETGRAMAVYSTVSSESPARYDVTFTVTQATPHGTYIIWVDDEMFGEVEVKRSDPLWAEGDIPERVDAAFADGITLLGYNISTSKPRPGDTITLDLYWRSTETPSTSYTVFTQIIGPFNPATNGPLWGQHDGLPLYGAFPILEWPKGMIVRDEHPILLDAGAQSGEYTILVGMYDAATGQRLVLSGDDDNAVEIGKIVVK